MRDVIVVGGGPAGVGCAIYTIRSNLDTLLISEDIGGQSLVSPLIENWIGFAKITGEELGKQLREQLDYLKVPIVEDRVTAVEKKDDHFLVTTRKDTYETKTVVFTQGSKHRKLAVEREEDLEGRGVSYCATCDMPFFKGKDVVIVGGGNSAFTALMPAADLCNKVYLVHRREQFRAEEVLIDKAKERDNVEFVLNRTVKKLNGDKFLESVELDDGTVIQAQGLFVEIGMDPQVELAKKLGVEINENGYVVVDAGMRTSVQGIYAAGDNTTGTNMFRQIVTAAAEGAIAANSVYEDVRLGGWNK